jgi:hypothetical protein
MFFLSADLEWFARRPELIEIPARNTSGDATHCTHFNLQVKESGDKDLADPYMITLWVSSPNARHRIPQFGLLRQFLNNNRALSDVVLLRKL